MTNMMKTETKLHIEIAGDVIDVQGDPALVETIYNDFKAHIEAVASTKAVTAPEVAPLVAMTHANIAEDNVFKPENFKVAA